MDWNVIIASVLAVVGSYVGNVAISSKKRREDEIREAEREARQQERMTAIEHKLDEHNRYAEKLNSIEKSMISMKKDIDYLRKEKS